MTRITPELMKARMTELIREPEEHQHASVSAPIDTDVFKSIENNSEFVRAAFLQILGRQPELEALLHFSRVLEDEPRETVIEFLRQSDEARLRAPSDSGSVELEDLCNVEPNSRFLSAAYARVFGRVADAGGLEMYLGDLERGVSREHILIDLCRSPEGRARDCKMTLHGRWVEDIFDTPETIETANAVQAPVHPVTLDIDDLLKIDEPREFLGAVYERAFGREPDAEGLVYWLNVLDETKSKYRVLHAISTQSETKLRGITFLLRGLPMEQGELSDLDQFIAPGRFVWEACRRIFGRDCSLEEFAGPRVLLHVGATRIQVLATIALAPASMGSPELFYWQGQPLTIPDLPLTIRIRTYLRRLWGPRQVDMVEHAICAQFKSIEQPAASSHGETLRNDQAIHPDRQPPAAKQADLASLSARLDDIQTATGSAQRSTVRLNEKLDTLRGELKAHIESLQRHVTAAVQADARPPVLTGHDVFVTKADDFILAIPREDWPLAAHYAFWGTVERGLVRRFQQTVRPGMTVVDVGANVGIYTLHAARAIGNAGKVFSFEPAPRTFEILKQNVEANRLHARVDLRAVAVLDKISHMPLYVEDVRCGLNSLYGPDSAHSVMVNAVPLDEALANVVSIDVIKIDAEGSEPRILRGMTRIITANPGLQIFLEFAPSNLLRGGIEPSAFLDELLTMGFNICLVDDFSGELLPFERTSLLAVFSANLSLRRIIN